MELPRWRRVSVEVLALRSQVGFFGNTALYHFWALWTEEDVNGRLTTWTRKQLDVWHKIDGQWFCIGGTATPTIH